MNIKSIFIILIWKFKYKRNRDSAAENVTHNAHKFILQGMLGVPSGMTFVKFKILF